MKREQATATIFMTAFRALPKGEREAVVSSLLDDDEFMNDLTDIALIRESRKEKGKDIPLEAYVESKK